jgi:hypothetical protein
MTRRPTVFVEGGTHHVYNRVDGGRAVDRKYLAVAEARERAGRESR